MGEKAWKKSKQLLQRAWEIILADLALETREK